MNRLTTDTPNGNLETMLNFAYTKNGDVWLRGADNGKDTELCAYIAKHAFYLDLCGITNKDDVVEACGSADCFCELCALFAAATQAAELRARLAAYEDTGLEPEQCAKYAQAEKEGRYIVLKEPRSSGVHRLEEIARADIEGRLVVLPRNVDDVVYIVDRLGVLNGENQLLLSFTSEDAEKALEGMNNDER